MFGATAEGRKIRRAPSGVDFISMGVSISKKFCESRYRLTSNASLCRNSRFLRTQSRRRSRYRYCMRRSSPPSLSSSIVKGGVSDVLSIFRLFTSISISPVGILRFLLYRSFTVPVTCITYSRPNLLAASQRAASTSLLNTNCVIP